MSLLNLNYWKKLPKDKRQRVVLIAIGTLAGIGAAGYMYVMPQVASISECRKKVAELKHQIDDAEGIERQAVKNERSRQELLVFCEGQRSLMVSGDPFSWLVREITLLAEQHPVRVSGLRSGSMIPHPRSKSFSTYNTSFELDGSYDEIGEFLRDFENKFPTAEVRSVEIAGDSDPRTKLHVVMKISILVRPQTASEKVVDSSAKPGGKGA